MRGDRIGGTVARLWTRRTAPRAAAWLGGAGVICLLAVPAGSASATGSPRLVAHVAGTQSTVYQLDCNGQSPLQRPNRSNLCTDIRGFPGVDNANEWGSRFYDNGFYIGHDEPDTTFLSTQKGSGDNVTWSLTLGRDPAALPTVKTPGADVSHWFELSPAPWFSMAVCDDFSYPQLPCVPQHDTNAPAPCTVTITKCSKNLYPGGGSAFVELQFYPPGLPPLLDATSCDDSHWCAALTIDSLECTQDYATCNNSCEEPQNFAFIQTDGQPDANGSIPDKQTLLMNPGDRVTVSMHDAPAVGGGHALLATIDDLTTKTTGSMQASAANGFVHTSIASCDATPYNFEPEYYTAAPGHYVPWAALQTDISTEFETGHFEACTSLTEEMPSDANPIDQMDPDGTTEGCAGPYEKTAEPKGEPGDAMCYNAGDTHPGYDGPGTSTPPDEVTGCLDNTFQNGDLDFDGTPYWHNEWPTGTTPSTRPSTFLESPPLSAGKPYASYFFQTDIALSESTCSTSHEAGCTVPPSGPGHFYPYWSLVQTPAGRCTFEFGQVASGTDLTTFGQDKQYGSVQYAQLGYPEFIGPLHPDTCAP